ncbi:MAG TPA: hypothetical protein VJR95_10155 [Rhodanobacter sp.]|nr:hypothetical protein [Rhodanobacter sp.]
MHLEPPNTRLNSFKDVAKHYLMIVLSILTALGLEAWIEHAHHAHAAAMASAQIEAELSDNLADIRKMHDADVQRLRALTQLDDYLIQAVKSGTDAATVRQHVDTLTKGQLYLGLYLPKMRHEAWDVAVANQSASWIDANRLHRYATIYADQSEFERRIVFNTSVNLQGSRMNDVDAGLKAGTIQPLEMMNAVNSMDSSVGDTVVALDSLERGFKLELPDLIAAAPASPQH